RRIHVVETLVTVVVKDINDNSPVFPNSTMFGEVQENGPKDLPVVVVGAWDADDDTDGTNARLTYSIEKNVIDEHTGEAIFSVEGSTGVVRTALCCLDRETTPHYTIQVVASDGGGLKGTGTVVIRVTDENDNSPKLSRPHWELEVNETPSNNNNKNNNNYNNDDYNNYNNNTLLELTATDKDTSNVFAYRVVEESGWGWDMFGVRVEGSTGHLYPLTTLDYEDERYRRGFRFKVQVTDKGDSINAWNDSTHLDTAWVTVKLRDLNDNPPVFSRPHAHVTLREDTRPGTLLLTLHAHDPDKGGEGGVDYSVEGGWEALKVDTEGGVHLATQLDREATGGSGGVGGEGVARIVAVDRGTPPLSTTATLSITVTDVNDCPPTLLPPTLLHVVEEGPPSLLGILKATDPDVWELGHGPPFNLTLHPHNTQHVQTLINLKFDPYLDSGRGGAELWTTGPVDREEHRQLEVGVKVTDVEGLEAVQNITIIIDDINDNPMKPAAKTVYLWKTQGGGSEAPLGRVYVEDPDDWDVVDKTFSWVGSPHPLFSLSPSDGTIYASSQLREGRYELQFSVSDRVWEQRGVAANVTVVVKLLAPDALTHATPILLTPTTPAQLTRGWSPTDGGGGLGSLLQGVLGAVGDQKNYRVEVVSVYGPCHTPTTPNTPNTPTPNTPTPTATSSSSFSSSSFSSSSACVWVCVKDEATHTFMDPVKLQGLLALYTHQLETVTGLTVEVKDPGAPYTTLHPEYSTASTDPLHLHHQHHQHHDDSATSLASTSLPLQVVDTNATSLVTPRLTHAHHTCHHPQRHPLTCTPGSCLNGGRCVRSSHGNRCICPGSSWGPRCKVLSRSFNGRGWAWVPPVPPCLPATLSLRILTLHPHGLLLYSGPLSPAPTTPTPTPTRPSPTPTPTPMLAVQLVDGRPEVLVEGVGGGSIKLKINTTIHDGYWHSLHLSLDAKGVRLMSDLCGHGWEDEITQDSSHCLAREEWQESGQVWWPGSGPLQVGGAAHSPHQPQQHRWQESPTVQHLQGCISQLTINTQVVDLGEPPFSHASSSGCEVQEAACEEACGMRGRCYNGVMKPICECDPGWFGSRCNRATVPVRLGVSSYMKLALSFTPPPRLLRVQVRLRTRGLTNGLLLHLAAHHRDAAFSIHLRAGVACVSVSGAGWLAQTVCVEGQPLGDGVWHTVRAERHGHSLVVEVDDGDDWRHNESLVWMMSSGSPQPLHLDKHDGVTVGGLPHFEGVSLVNVQQDLQDTCLDDLRVSGHPLPLSPGVNRTNWGQVTTLEQFESGCPPPNPDPCKNTTCSLPLTCHLDWDQPTCSCGPGRQLVGRRCEDVDECVAWRPCLHGATCHNTRPGYLCVCSPRHLGDNCQWNRLPHDTHPLAAPAVVVALLTVSLLVLVMLGVVLSLRLHRLRVMRSGLHQTTQVGEKGNSNENLREGGGGTTEGGVAGGGEERLRVVDCMGLRGGGGTTEEGGAGSGGGVAGGGVGERLRVVGCLGLRGGDKKKMKSCSTDDINNQDTLLQLLKLKLTGDRQQQQQPRRVKKDKDQRRPSEGINLGVIGIGGEIY
ncbi:hypothetical protein Pcinc_033702, partial [Petrolisthes cinctipes]